MRLRGRIDALYAELGRLLKVRDGSPELEQTIRDRFAELEELEAQEADELSDLLRRISPLSVEEGRALLDRVDRLLGCTG